MDPGPGRWQGTAAYRRGQTLHDAIYAPILPAHLDPHYQRSTGASLQFEELYGRELTAGDMLQRSDIERCHEWYLSRVARFIAAWQRQIPEALCPLKIEDGCLYEREMAGLGGREAPGGWREAIENRQCFESAGYAGSSAVSQSVSLMSITRQLKHSFRTAHHPSNGAGTARMLSTWAASEWLR